MSTAWLVRRVLSVGWVLLGVSVLAFSLVRVIPGDVATVLLGIRYTPEEAALLRERYGLEAPLPVQYGRWVLEVARGNLGTTTTGNPVASELGQALGVTASLAGLALLLALALGVGGGTVAALTRRKRVEDTLSVASLAGVSLPNFWIGTLLVLGAAVYAGWLPSGGFIPPGGSVIEALRHLLLPAVALALPVASVLMRTTWSAVTEAKGAPHVRTAHAKGLPARRVVIRHVLRNALSPVLTVAGVQGAWLLGGSVVIEELFSLPGVGRLAIDALQRRDYATLQAIILLAGAVFAGVNLVVDVVQARLDPRVAEEAQRG